MQEVHLNQPTSPIVSPEAAAMSDVLGANHESEPFIDRARRFIRASAIYAVSGLGVSTVALGGGAAIDADIREDVIEVTGDIVAEVADGITPTPPVSSVGTESLIKANNLLRDGGPFVLGAAVLGYGSLQIMRRRSEALDGKFEYIKGGQKRTFLLAELALATTIIASTGVASGLGDSAAEGANAPVRMMEEALSNGEEIYVIAQHIRAIPFNSASVTPENLAIIKTLLPEDSKVLPFIWDLGDAINPGKATNPSSAPIVAIPNAGIQEMFGVSLPADGELSAIIGEQLGADEGDKVLVQGMNTKVAATLDMAPGLDRVGVIGSLEQMHSGMFANKPYWGAVLNGVEDPVALQNVMKEAGVPYVVTDFEHLTKLYTDFWERSVKPPEMQLILFTLATGAIGAGFIRVADILQRRKNIAINNAMGVEMKDLKQAETIRRMRNGLIAGGLAVPAIIALTAVTNSSQYGLELSAGVNSVGAGFTAYMLASAAGGKLANRMLVNTDTAVELRG